MRGVAIFLVVGFHYLGVSFRLPYGERYADILPFKYGSSGVHLFFLISGFVILLTLERCSSFSEFIKKRWLRLFPAMLVASIFLLSMSQMFSTYPHGARHLVDLLPGLTFINEAFWHSALRTEVHSIDGVFWTLYTEFAFYLTFGFLYFRLGSGKAIAALMAVWAAAKLSIYLFEGHRFIEPLIWLRVTSFIWFASGALFLKAAQSRKLFAPAMVTGACAVLTQDAYVYADMGGRVMDGTMLLLFAAAQDSHIVQRALSVRWLLFAGFVSYPLYLIHCALGVALISLAGSRSIVVPITIAAGMISLSWAIAKFAEPPITRVLKALVLRRQPNSIAAAV